VAESDAVWCTLRWKTVVQGDDFEDLVERGRPTDEAEMVTMNDKKVGETIKSAVEGCSANAYLAPLLQRRRLYL
jgi:hypothetical protein